MRDFWYSFIVVLCAFMVIFGAYYLMYSYMENRPNIKLLYKKTYSCEVCGASGSSKTWCKRCGEIREMR